MSGFSTLHPFTPASPVAGWTSRSVAVSDWLCCDAAGEKRSFAGIRRKMFGPKASFFLRCISAVEWRGSAVAKGYGGLRVRALFYRTTNFYIRHLSRTNAANASRKSSRSFKDGARQKFTKPRLVARLWYWISISSRVSI